MPPRSARATPSEAAALSEAIDAWAAALPRRPRSEDGRRCTWAPESNPESQRSPRLSLEIWQGALRASVIAGAPGAVPVDLYWDALLPSAVALGTLAPGLRVASRGGSGEGAGGDPPSASLEQSITRAAEIRRWAGDALAQLRLVERRWQEIAGDPVGPPASSADIVGAVTLTRNAEHLGDLLGGAVTLERDARDAGSVATVLTPGGLPLELSVDTPAGELVLRRLERMARIRLASPRLLWLDRLEAAAISVLGDDAGGIRRARAARAPDLYVGVGGAAGREIAARVTAQLSRTEFAALTTDELGLPAVAAKPLLSAAPRRLLLSVSPGQVDYLAEIESIAAAPRRNGATSRRVNAARLRVASLNPLEGALSTRDLTTLAGEPLEAADLPHGALVLPLPPPDESGAALLSAGATAAEAVDMASPEVPLRRQAGQFFPYLKPYLPQAIVVVVLNIISPILAGYMLFLLAQIVGDIFGHNRAREAGHVLTFYVGAMIIKILVDFTEDYLSSWTSGRFTATLRNAIYRHLQSLSVDSLARLRQGDLLTRLSTDASAMDTLVLGGGINALQASTSVVVYGYLMFNANHEVAIALLLAAPIFFLVGREFGRRVRVASRLARRRSSQVLSTAEEGLAGMIIVHAFNQQGREVGRFGKRVDQAFRASMRATLYRASYAASIQSITNVLGVAVMIYGASTLRGGGVFDGRSLLQFLLALTAIAGPVRTFSALNASLQGVGASGERLIELFTMRPSVPDPGGEPPAPSAEGAVEFRGVGFRYRPERPVLHDVTFQTSPGEIVALVGSSGAGKTTVVRLLERFHDPQDGEILLDGRDLRTLPLWWLREQVGLVLSDPYLFNDTVRENILFGRPDATEDELMEAARISGVLDFAPQLPRGLDTRVGTRGGRLSTGQQQRVALARAILKRAPILVLDEAMAGIDARSEGRIQDAINELMRGRTVFVIAHRLSTVQAADRILVLENGRVVQEGGHARLAREEGPYRSLYLRQLEQTA